MKKISIQILVILMVFFPIVLNLHAKQDGAQQNDKSEKKEAAAVDKTVTENREFKEISGVVSAVTSNFIAIAYENQGGVVNEIALPLHEQVEFLRKRSIKEINAGDTVSVRYEQVKTQLNGKDKIERQATKITFLKSGS